ncbi:MULTISPECIES: hypothetical protein [Arthrobacter]|uniref:Uncharacterized protein n=1 Tax=Arthrobacter terricola TaxID=2547396 RepID=A0A4R5KC23_9MICC|nr:MULTISPECIES: hypothetical protein [Arthrobacter]MBT8162782.1 hypothetical protein [Arthrobacter sp. GN70]TDF92058.1 hypothetical protein E1809_18940 [Arthrobacter terricola]
MASQKVPTLDGSGKVRDKHLPDRLGAPSLSATFIPFWRPNTDYAAAARVINPNGDVVTAKTDHNSGESYAASKWNLSSSYPNVVTSGTGVYMVNDPTGTHKPTPIFGDAGSMGFAGTGAPAGIAGGLGWYKKFGSSSPGAPVLKTTQGLFGNTLYYGPTTDDSAEGGSSSTFLKDDGNIGWAQTKPVISWEANTRVEGSVQAMGGDMAPVGGMGARLNVLGAAHVASGFGFKTSVQNDLGATGTIDKYVAYWQQVPSGAANAYGLYVADAANSESQVSVGRSAGTAFKAKYGGDADGSTSLVQIGQPTTALATVASGPYTLTTSPQNLTVNAGATLAAGGGTFILDSASRTIVSYTSFSGTTITGATVASGSATATTGQALLDPSTPNTTALRINAQKGQAKNLTEWFDSGSNLRVRVNAQGNLVTQGTSFFAANGSATTLASMNGATGAVTPGSTAGLGSAIYSGNGAPNIAASVSGDYYYRKDTPLVPNQRIYVATAANTWTAIA